MLRSWACRESFYHCPHIKQINVASKSGDNIGLVWKFIEASFEDITIIKLRITYTRSSLSYLLAFYGIPIFNTFENFLWNAHALGHNGYIKSSMCILSQTLCRHLLQHQSANPRRTRNMCGTTNWVIFTSVHSWSLSSSLRVCDRLATLVDSMQGFIHMSLELSRFLFSGSRISDQSDGTGFIMRGSRYTPCVATSGAYKVHLESGTAVELRITWMGVAIFHACVIPRTRRNFCNTTRRAKC